jgi:CheY-like chemotaxis protein
MSAVAYRSFAVEAAERRPTVLVVDDEVLIRMMLCESLRQAGCEVIEAASADEALDVLASAPTPDVLVTDVKMPGSCDGLELASRIREDRPGLKVVITSGHTPAQSAIGLADAFLPKPFALEQLVGRVRALTARP